MDGQFTNVGFRLGETCYRDKRPNGRPNSSSLAPDDATRRENSQQSSTNANDEMLHLREIPEDGDPSPLLLNRDLKASSDLQISL